MGLVNIFFFSNWHFWLKEILTDFVLFFYAKRQRACERTKTSQGTTMEASVTIASGCCSFPLKQSRIFLFLTDDLYARGSACVFLVDVFFFFFTYEKVGKGTEKRRNNEEEERGNSWPEAAETPEKQKRKQKQSFFPTTEIVNFCFFSANFIRYGISSIVREGEKKWLNDEEGREKSHPVSHFAPLVSRGFRSAFATHTIADERGSKYVCVGGEK